MTDRLQASTIWVVAWFGYLVAVENGTTDTVEVAFL
jgi:hypothetical protein